MTSKGDRWVRNRKLKHVRQPPYTRSGNKSKKVIKLKDLALVDTTQKSDKI